MQSWKRNENSMLEKRVTIVQVSKSVGGVSLNHLLSGLAVLVRVVITKKIVRLSFRGNVVGYAEQSDPLLSVDRLSICKPLNILLISIWLNEIMLIFLYI